jgi:hypothetical protein
MEVAPAYAAEPLKPGYHPNGEFPASIVVKNVSKAPVLLPRTMVPPVHWLKVRLWDPDGRSVPWFAHPPKIGDPELRRWVGPGQSISVPFDLHLVFDINRAGRYQVQANFDGLLPASVHASVSVGSPLYQFYVVAKVKPRF